MALVSGPGGNPYLNDHDYHRLALEELMRQQQMCGQLQSGNQYNPGCQSTTISSPERDNLVLLLLPA